MFHKLLICSDGSEGALMAAADYVGGGSGLTGATIARTLVDAGASVVVLERPRPHAAGEDDDVRCAHLFEGGVDVQPEHPVVAAHLADGVAHEHNVEGRDALQDFVGPNGVERGELGEERYGDLQRVRHADVLSFGTARKRRR